MPEMSKRCGRLREDGSYIRDCSSIAPVGVLRRDILK